MNVLLVGSLETPQDRTFLKELYKALHGLPKTSVRLLKKGDSVDQRFRSCNIVVVWLDRLFEEHVHFHALRYKELIKDGELVLCNSLVGTEFFPLHPLATFAIGYATSINMGCIGFSLVQNRPLHPIIANELDTVCCSITELVDVVRTWDRVCGYNPSIFERGGQWFHYAHPYDDPSGPFATFQDALTSLRAYEHAIGIT